MSTVGLLASDEIDSIKYLNYTNSIKYLTYTNYGHRATYCSRAGLPNLFTSTGHIYGRKVIAGEMHFYQDSTPKNCKFVVQKSVLTLASILGICSQK